MNKDPLHSIRPEEYINAQMDELSALRLDYARETARADSAVRVQSEVMLENEALIAEVDRIRTGRAGASIFELERVMAENDRLCEGLKRLEWSQVDGLRYCSQCSSQYSNGHKPYCWLAALLEKK